MHGYRYLSNWFPGRPQKEASDLRRCETTEERLAYLAATPTEATLIWILHHADGLSKPAEALLYAEAAIAVAEDLDRDLRSWAYSSRGNQRRQLDPDDAAVVADLDRAVELAQLPNEKANAIRRRSFVELDHSRPLAARELLAEAIKIENTADEHFNSDRGQPMLQNTHYTALLESCDPPIEECCRGNIELVQKACTKHAPRARLSALANLAGALGEELIPEDLVETSLELLRQAYDTLAVDHRVSHVTLAPKTRSLQVLLMRFGLEKYRINQEGWGAKARERMLFILSRLREISIPHASYVALEIAARDVATGRPYSIQEALRLLCANVDILRASGDGHVADLVSRLGVVRAEKIRRDSDLRSHLSEALCNVLRPYAPARLSRP
jgi:tetratricopeptide (TPR) repeat protein